MYSSAHKFFEPSQYDAAARAFAGAAAAGGGQIPMALLKRWTAEPPNLAAPITVLASIMDAEREVLDREVSPEVSPTPVRLTRLVGPRPSVAVRARVDGRSVRPVAAGRRPEHPRGPGVYTSHASYCLEYTSAHGTAVKLRWNAPYTAELPVAGELELSLELHADYPWPKQVNRRSETSSPLPITTSRQEPFFARQHYRWAAAEAAEEPFFARQHYRWAAAEAAAHDSDYHRELDRLGLLERW